MATSTIPALKGKLRDALKADAGLHDVLVTWGWPDAPAAEMILVGDVPEWHQEPAAMKGAAWPVEEEYVLELIVHVERAGTDQESATRRAFEIAAEIENVIRADYAVGATVRVAQFESGQLQEMAGDQTRLALLTCRVGCAARI